MTATTQDPRAGTSKRSVVEVAKTIVRDYPIIPLIITSPF